MSKVPGLGERIGARLRALGYWKKGRPDVLRFCQEKSYRPQYVYAWLKDRVPTYENLYRLSIDLRAPMAWIMFGQEGGVLPAARPLVLEMAGGESSPAHGERSERCLEPGPFPAVSRGGASVPAPGRASPPPAQIIDFRRLREVTDRLVQLEGELEAIFHAFPDLYFWVDPEGMILSYKAGRGSEPFLGPEAYIGTRLREIGPPDVGRLLHEACLETLHTGELVAVEYALPFPNGVRHREARFLTLGGGVAGHRAVLAIVRDITERKQAEDATRALVRVGHELAGTLDLAQATQRVVSTVLQLFRVRRSALYRLDGESGLWQVAAAAGEGDASAWVGRTVPASAGVAGRAIAERRPAWSSDVLTDPALTLSEPMRRRIEEEGYRSTIAVPLTARGEAFGALVLTDSVGRVFTGAEVQLLSVFADQAALALENARLYTEAEQGRQENARLYAEAEHRRSAAESLSALGRALAQSLDPEEVSQRIADGVRALLGAQVAAVHRVDAETGDVAIRACSGDVGPGFGRDVVFPTGTGVVGLAVRERAVVTTPDLVADPRISFTPEMRARVEQAAFRAVLAAPLLAKDRVIGALSVADAPGRVFTGEEIRLVQAFADQAALALENARLYAETERRRKAAESLARLGGLALEQEWPS